MRNYELEKRIEEISSNVFALKINRYMSDYREDIFKSLKNYARYDPDLKAFRNISIEHYNEIIDEHLEIRLKEVDRKIKTTIDNKINTLANEYPINIVTESVSNNIDKKYEDKINNTYYLSLLGVGLGIASFIYNFNQK